MYGQAGDIAVIPPPTRCRTAAPDETWASSHQTKLLPGTTRLPLPLPPKTKPRSSADIRGGGWTGLCRRWSHTPMLITLAISFKTSYLLLLTRYAGAGDRIFASNSAKESAGIFQAPIAHGFQKTAKSRRLPMALQSKRLERKNIR
jgi:hypothetical protein